MPWHRATSAPRRSRVAVSRCFPKSSGSTSRSPVRHGGGTHSPASSRPWRAIALSIRSPSLQCASIDSGFITIGWTRSRSSKTCLAARSSSGDACERMATSQSLVARAVPRALDPYSTTASMPGIEPTASAAVRLRRVCVVVFIRLSVCTEKSRSPRPLAMHAGGMRDSQLSVKHRHHLRDNLDMLAVVRAETRISQTISWLLLVIHDMPCTEKYRPACKTRRETVFIAPRLGASRPAARPSIGWCAKSPKPCIPFKYLRPSARNWMSYTHGFHRYPLPPFGTAYRRPSVRSRASTSSMICGIVLSLTPLSRPSWIADLSAAT